LGLEKYPCIHVYIYIFVIFEVLDNDINKHISSQNKGQTGKDDTEIDESSDEDKKTDTKLSSLEEEKKTESKDVDETEIGEEDETEIKEKSDDTESKIEPLVHDGVEKVAIGKTHTEDVRDKEDIKREEGHLKDIVQAQVEDAIKQTELEHKDVREMQMEKASESKQTDPVVKEEVEDRVEVPDAGKDRRNIPFCFLRFSF